MVKYIQSCELASTNLPEINMKNIFLLLFLVESSQTSVANDEPKSVAKKNLFIYTAWHEIAILHTQTPHPLPLSPPSPLQQFFILRLTPNAVFALLTQVLKPH